MRRVRGPGSRGSLRRRGCGWGECRRSAGEPSICGSLRRRGCGWGEGAPVRSLQRASAALPPALPLQSSSPAHAARDGRSRATGAGLYGPPRAAIRAATAPQKNQARFRGGQAEAGFSMSHMSETYGRLPSSLLLSVALLRSVLSATPRSQTRTISMFSSIYGALRNIGVL